MSRSARAPWRPKHFCAFSDRDPIAWPTFSPAAAPPTAATARIRIASTSTSSCR